MRKFKDVKTETIYSVVVDSIADIFANDSNYVEINEESKKNKSSKSKKQELEQEETELELEQE